MTSEQQWDAWTEIAKRSRLLAEAEAAKEYAFISDALSDTQINAVPVRFFSPSTELPQVHDFKGIKVAYVFGRLNDPEAAIRLAGTMQLAQRQYAMKIVFAYHKHVYDADRAFLRKLGIPLPDPAAEQFIASCADEFREYFTENSVGADMWAAYELSDEDILARIGPAPVAFRTEGETNVVYVVPYNLPKQIEADAVFERLHDAVLLREESMPGRLPEFLGGVRLGGYEERTLEEARAVAQRLNEQMREVRALERWRHLVGRTSGAILVGLVVEALNVILDGSGYRAEQREERYAEDFWIVGADGRDAALAEAKGQGGGVSRENVNQVDSHREQLKTPDDFPGLLVVNIFRNKEDLAKRTDVVAGNVISRAVQQNVVVMRTWDLYQLLGAKLNGGSAANTLIEALEAPNGGWLRVSEDGASELVA